MKSWFILIGVAVAAMAAGTVALPYLQGHINTARGPVLVAPPRPEGPSPIATIEGDSTFQFGVLPQHFKSTHSWTIRNTGEGPLELKGMSTTCSCTTSDLFKEMPDKTHVGIKAVINPGDLKVVVVTFETKTFDAFRQAITIATNDPTHPQLVLGIEGKVRPAVATFPADPAISFTPVSNEDPTTRWVFVFSADRPDLKLLKLVSSNPDLIAVDSRPMTPEEQASLKVEKGYALSVTTKPTPNLGEFNEEVVVETDHPQKSELRIRVRGKTIGAISITPEKLTMRDASADRGGAETLNLWVRGRTEVNFIVDRKPKGMDVAIESIPVVAGLKGSKYKMTVKLAPGVESGRITDEIVLKTDDPKVHELRLPVDVLVQGAR